MILGIGADVINIDRIHAALRRHGNRFLGRIYTDGEQGAAARMQDRAGVLAKRWAAKEACAKALGTGMKQGVSWKDIEITNRPGGMPGLILKQGARRRLARMLPPGRRAVLHLTMTDDRPCAAAFVVIEAVPVHPAGPPAETAS